MDLSNIGVQVRPRSPYEAIDLGCMMARQWYLSLVSLWLLWALPVMLISYLLFADRPWWALLLVWWLKPLFESLQLKYISEKLFDDRLHWKSALADSHKTIFRHVLAKLITHRLAFSRSFDMPVTELEGLKGKIRRRRLQTMHRDGNAAGFWLTMIGHGIETTFVVAVFSLTWMFIPMQMSIDFELQKLLDSVLLFPTITLCAFVAMTLVAPFYVCGGFMLYINRRTLLEAWDVELVFRQLASNYQRSSKTLLALLTPLIVVLALLSKPTPVLANSPEQSRTRIIEILEAEDYHNWHGEQGWRLKQSDTNGDAAHWFDDISQWLNQWTPNLNGLPDLGALFMLLLEGLLWLALAILIAYLVYRYRHLVVPEAERNGSESTRPGGKIFGLELSDKAFDNQVVDLAKDYWNNGKQRQALSHMYRAALSYLVYERRLPLHSSQTEQECMRLCQASEPQFRSEYFADLTRHWIDLAYAHRVLTDAEFSSLCQHWAQFSAAGQEIHHA